MSREQEGWVREKMSEGCEAHKTSRMVRHGKQSQRVGMEQGG